MAGASTPAGFQPYTAEERAQAGVFLAFATSQVSFIKLFGIGLKAPQPAVPVKKSITPDFIICLEDGKKFKSLKRHLRTRYSMSPDEYRAKWNLPPDYPMALAHC